MTKTVTENPYFKHVDRAPYELGYLLKKLPVDFSEYEPLTPDTRLIAEAAQHHASNALNSLTGGISTMGSIVTMAALNEEGSVQSRHLASLGDLIGHLAAETEFMQEIHDTTRAALTADDLRTAEKKPPQAGREGGAA